MRADGDGMDVFALLGIKLSHLVAGVAGGVVRAFLVGTTWIGAISSVIIGAVTAAYMTTPITRWFERLWNMTPDPSTEHAVAFVVGLTAMLICEGAIRAAQKWSKNPRLPKP